MSSFDIDYRETPDASLTKPEIAAKKPYKWKEKSKPNIDKNPKRESERGACGEHLRSGVDVADIGGDTGGPSDIVKGELGNQRVELHQQRQRLPDTPGGAKDGDLALGDGVGGVATSSDVGRGASRHGRL
jgi:hypothetical protein